MSRQITPKELNRRIDGVLHYGKIGIRDARRGEIITIHTDPAIYEIEVISPPCMLVNVKSKQDITFWTKKPCRFMGSMWENAQDITCWEEAPMSMFGVILKDCYFAVEHLGHLLVLPKVFEAEVDGVPFFNNTELHVQL